MPLYSVCLLLFFYLEPTLGKDAWMRATFAAVMVIFSKVPFWKLLDRNFIQIYFSTIAKVHWLQHFERHLTLKILRTWFKIRGNSFIKTWVNITLHLKEYCTKVDERSLIVICVFFPKANLVFKSNPVFIDILDSFCHSYLHFCLLIIDILWSLNFIQCLYAFFYKKK